jgi:hypothetical protein
MKSLRLNRKGQFSIIAALLVAVVLIGAVITTYASIRYNSFSSEPQTLSSIDEINLALKRILGFTVGYYGSVLQVTGNITYAKMLASNYLSTGLDNIADIRPELSPSFSIENLDLKTNWFTNTSYSSGNFTIKYDLGGIGIHGMTYMTSSRLNVEILNSPSFNQALVNVSNDDGPLVNLGQRNFKFYKYNFTKTNWEMVYPAAEPTTYMDGRYLLELPAGMNSTYILQVEDTRGLMVVSSSFSRIISSLTWNTTAVEEGFHFVDNNSSDLDSSPNKGSQTNFEGQQSNPDGIYSTITEAQYGTTPLDSYPNIWNALGLTTCPSGTVANLQSNDATYMTLRSYATAMSPTTVYAHREQTSISGTNYYQLQLASADSGGTTLSMSAKDPARQLMGRFVIPLSGISSVPASAWTIYYRASKSSSSVVANCNVDILVRRSNGNIRSTIATTVASSANMVGTSFSTLSGTYAFPDYNVVDQTDYLEIDYYITITTGAGGNPNVNLRIDDNDLALSDQTRIENINMPSEYTAKAEFTGQQPFLSNWNDLIWAIDSAASTSGVSVIFQLYDYQAGAYPSSGSGYLADTIGTTDFLKTQTIAGNMGNFRNATGYWKINVTAVKSTTAQFDFKLDLMKYSPSVPNYASDIEEQWVNINATNPRQDLCIKSGPQTGAETLIVQVRWRNTWVNLMTLYPNTFNNASLAPYIDSENLTIRFIGNNDAADPTQDSWNIDSSFIKSQPNIDFLVNLQESTFTIEVLQNGTMRWLGQNLQLTTQENPIPPVSVKALHVNQTLNGVNQEVPFQIEDWASEYQIPLGLASNSTVFGNRQMIVFQVNNKVTDFTVWWDGSDTAVQTPLAYTTNYFRNDDPTAATLTNGNVTLKFGSFYVNETVSGTSTTSTAYFMRINSELSTYGAGLAYVIHHGVVRDVVQQEAEWGTDMGGGGAQNSPNLYANIVITLPANVTYYTYRLRIMFINSTQSRTISDLCPIRLTTNLASTQLQTENGTIGGFPYVINGTDTFSNYAGIGNWTAHHFSQFITNDGKQGAGIMFSDSSNRKLYAFDSMPASTSKGALRTNSNLIELLPVSASQVSFNSVLDITWMGAVATFDNTLPVCKMFEATTPTGLWILAEYPPTLTVTAKN